MVQTQCRAANPKTCFHFCIRTNSKSDCTGAAHWQQLPLPPAVSQQLLLYGQWAVSIWDINWVLQLGFFPLRPMSTGTYPLTWLALDKVFGCGNTSDSLFCCTVWVKGKKKKKKQNSQVTIHSSVSRGGSLFLRKPQKCKFQDFSYDSINFVKLI